MPATILFDSEDEEEDLLQDSLSTKEGSIELSGTTSSGHSQPASLATQHDMASKPGSLRRCTSSVISSKSSVDLKRRHSEIHSTSSPADSAQGRLKRIKSASKVLSNVIHSKTTDSPSELRSSSSRGPSTQATEPAGLSNVKRNKMPQPSGDTMPYTEQTQIVMDEMVAHAKKTRPVSRKSTASSELLSLSWSLDKSTASAKCGEKHAVSTHHSSGSDQSAFAGEACHMIDQLLENGDQKSSSSHKTADRDLEPSNVSQPKVLRSKTDLTTAQGSQDELAASVARSKPTRHASRPTHAAAPARSSLQVKVGSTQTVDPALLEPDSEMQTAVEQASTGDEIVVTARKSGRLVDQGSSDISMERVVELLRTKPTASQQSEPDFSSSQSLPGPAEQSPSVSASMKPPPKPKKAAKKKSKRSHTTIFEDHVELEQKHESLSLSQQQARRKAVLGPLQDGQSKANSSHRQRTRVVDDEHDEDALPVPASIAKPAAAITEDSQVSVDSRGKVSKQASEPDHASDPTDLVGIRETATDVDQPDQQHTDDQQTQKSPQTLVQQKSPVSTTPTTHSPLKISSAISFRVGLSRRQRIPSLLRVVRPAKAT